LAIEEEEEEEEDPSPPAAASSSGSCSTHRCAYLKEGGGEEGREGEEEGCVRWKDIKE